MKVVEGKTEKVILKAIKSGNCDVICSIEKNTGKNYMKQRNSGLNQVICKMAKEKQVTVGFDFNDLCSAKNRGDILGKMMQNVKLCTKYKVKMYVFDSKKKRLANDLKAFASVIGMKPKDVKNCLSLGKKQKDVEIIK